MLKRIRQIFASKPERARRLELRGEFLEASELHLAAGETSEAARLLEQLGDRPTLSTEARLHHYQQALRLLEPIEGRRRLARKMLPLVDSTHLGQTDRRMQCELLELLGRNRERGEVLESAGRLEEAMQAYVRGGLIDQVERLGEIQQRLAQSRQKVTTLFVELDRARANGDRLAEITVLRQIAGSDSSIRRVSTARRELETLKERLPGPRVGLDSEAMKAPIEIRVESSLLLGRDFDADLRLSGAGVSRRHARLFLHENRGYIEDLASRNGTFVDEVQLDGMIEMPDEAELRLGLAVKLRVRTLGVRPDTAGGLLLQSRSLRRPVILLFAEISFGSGPELLRSRHPALAGAEDAFRLVAKDGHLHVSPGGGSSKVLVSDRQLEGLHLPFLEEAWSVDSVPFRLFRLELDE